MVQHDSQHGPTVPSSNPSRIIIDNVTATPSKGRKWKLFQKGEGDTAVQPQESSDNQAHSSPTKSRKHTFKLPTIASPRKAILRSCSKQTQKQAEIDDSSCRSSKSSELALIGGLPLWEQPTAIEISTCCSRNSSQSRRKKKHENPNPDDSGTLQDANVSIASISFDEMSLGDLERKIDDHEDEASRSPSSSGNQNPKRTTSCNGSDSKSGISYFSRGDEVACSLLFSVRGRTHSQDDGNCPSRTPKINRSTPKSSTKISRRPPQRKVCTALDAQLNKSLNLLDVFDLDPPGMKMPENVDGDTLASSTEHALLLSKEQELLEMVMEKSRHDFDSRHDLNKKCAKSSLFMGSSQHWNDVSGDDGCSTFREERNQEDAEARRIALEQQETELIKLAMERSLRDVHSTSNFDTSRKVPHRSFSVASGGPQPPFPPRRATTRSQVGNNLRAAIPVKPGPLSERASALIPRSNQCGLGQRGKTPTTSLCMSELEMIQEKEKEMMKRAMQLSMQDVQTFTPNYG